MRFLSALVIAGLASLAVAGRSPEHVGEGVLPRSRQNLVRPKSPRGPKLVQRPEYKFHRRAGATILPQNANTTKYAVDGTAIPDVDFDVGESYAGLMPLSHAANETREFYFWFFPSSNVNASQEITIWLNGGPGCSSLEGLFQENGPFVWQFGTYRPVPNPWSYKYLTNTVWIEQPLGTGFDQGTPTATSQEDVAAQFLGFWEVFMDTFGLQSRKVYITGESYAGKYIPYIAKAMIDAKDKKHYNLQGIQIIDPSTSYNAIQRQIPALPFANFHHNLFSLNTSYQNKMTGLDQSCGYKAYRNKYFTFPPPGPLPTPPTVTSECNIWRQIYAAAALVNPCFDIYQVATTCPVLFDPLGFPGSFPYQPAGFNIYFNRTDVQKAINAPIMEWNECSDGVLDTDTSPPSGLAALPYVIGKIPRVLIAHGQLDYILLPNGTLLMIQNMTWGGKQGFQSMPKTPFFVPYHEPGATEALAGAGRLGTFHTERGLTWVETWLSGHMIPQYAPSAAFRQLEFLLGRIPNLGYVSDFTTEVGYMGNVESDVY